MTNEEAIKLLSNRYMVVSECIDSNNAIKENIAIDMAIEALEKQAEIVHCKDCKHWVSDAAGCTESVKRCEFANWMVGKNGFCVYGDRWKNGKS